MPSKHLDMIYETGITLESDDQLAIIAQSHEFISHLKEKFGKVIPYAFSFKNLDGTKVVKHYQPTKGGIAMDWVYFAGLEEITEDVINAEENIEKRLLLMLEYGIDKFLKDVVTIDVHPAYGTYFSADIGLRERQAFIKVYDPQPLSKEEHKYCKEKGMLVQHNGKECKVTYIPVELDYKTMKQALESTYPIDIILPEEGFDYEC